VARASALLLLAVVAASAVLTYSATQVPTPGRAEVEELLEAVSYAVGRLSALGFDVSRAAELLGRARGALEAGDPARARSLAIQSLLAAGSSVRASAGSPQPVGLVLEASLLKSVATSLGLGGVVERVSEAESLLARGDVAGAARALEEARGAARAAQLELARLVAGRAAAEVEEVLRREVPAEVVPRLVEVVRTAKSLRDLVPAVRVARWVPRVLPRVLEEVDVGLDEVGAEALREVGELPPELASVPEVRGLVARAGAMREALLRLRGRVFGELALALNAVLSALGNLSRAVDGVARCSPDYVRYLENAARASEEALEHLSRARVAAGPQLAAARQVHAVATWVRSVVRYLPNYVRCPAEGSRVVLRGVVVEASAGYALVYGYAVTWGARAVGARVGLYVLSLPGQTAGLSRGDVVEVLGTYVGLGRSGYPEVVVERLLGLGG
jgi:hypothetical protein